MFGVRVDRSIRRSVATSCDGGWPRAASRRARSSCRCTCSRTTGVRGPALSGRRAARARRPVPAVGAEPAEDDVAYVADAIRACARRRRRPRRARRRPRPSAAVRPRRRTVARRSRSASAPSRRAAARRSSSGPARGERRASPVRTRSASASWVEVLGHPSSRLETTAQAGPYRLEHRDRSAASPSEGSTKMSAAARYGPHLRHCCRAARPEPGRPSSAARRGGPRAACRARRGRRGTSTSARRRPRPVGARQALAVGMARGRDDQRRVGRRQCTDHSGTGGAESGGGERIGRAVGDPAQVSPCP